MVNLRRPSLKAALAVLLGSCAPAEPDPTVDSTSAPGADSTQAGTSQVTCYVADQSVLARADADTMDRPLRGWIRLDRTRRDSGPALLVDSDGYSLEATFQQLTDSIFVSGFNDFVRIEFRLRAGDSGARGTYRAHSDAALERDSTGTLREFRRSGDVVLAAASCDSLPRVIGVAMDVARGASPRPGIRFDPSRVRPGARIGDLVLDSIAVQQALDSTLTGTATFRGEIALSGWTLRNPDPEMYRVMTCFEADSTSAARLPRWSGDERRAWFCFSNRADAARALGPPSEGVPARIVIEHFTIHRGMSDEVNSARFVRRLDRGAR
ncbi:MAG TPA: hypothetical protein VFZ73_03160 [Gemmatimonadaceae bacterium]